jgi:hypothetical protein
MLLTIIPVDGNVKKDEVGYIDLDLSSCGIPSNVRALQWQETTGWIEFWDQQNENITALPSWTDCCLAAWTAAANPPPPPPPEPPTAEQNKQTAISILQATDWTQIPSVSDPALSNPYLANKNAFDIYRNSVRQYALNPVAGNINWPVMPTEVWTAV